MNHYELTHIFCTFFMTGVIWIIQFVHYPSFRFVEDAQYTKFQHFHINRITPIVASAMIIELATSLYLAILMGTNKDLALFLLTLFIWLITFTMNVPIHRALLKEKSLHLIRKQVLFNLPRTMAWSIKSLILIAYL